MRPALNFHLTVNVLLFAFIATASPSFAANLVMVTPLEMNFRTEPSADSAPVGDCPKLYSGMILTVYEEQGEWYYVEDMYGHKGWARAVYEGEVYLQDLPDNYLETNISAQTALDRAKPIALDWAEDAYAYKIYGLSGWNGLCDYWEVFFFSPSKKEYPGYSYPEFFRVLIISVCSDGDEWHEHVENSSMSVPEGQEKPLPMYFLDSKLLYTPEKIAEYRQLSIIETPSLTLSGGEWTIENNLLPGVPFVTLILDAVSGEILRVE